MSEQQDNPKRSVVVPVVVLILAIGLFGYAFYALDGLALVDDLLGTSFSGRAAVRPEPDVETQESLLELPEGMTEEFALRLWQEQLDSQANIARLVSGEVERIDITDVESGAEAATLTITAFFTDGTSAPGNIGMSKIGGNWYFAFVSGTREGDTGGFADDTNAGTGEAPKGELPEIEDVDVPLLNTILAQQTASSTVLEEYSRGAIRSIVIDDVQENLGTRTLSVVMNEDHEQGKGTLVAISKEIDGESTWFIAKFSKAASQ